MNNDKMVNGKEFSTEIVWYKLNHQDLICEAGTNGQQAYVRFSPYAHDCIVIELEGEENVKMMAEALQSTAEILKKQLEKIRETEV